MVKKISCLFLIVILLHSILPTSIGGQFTTTVYANNVSTEKTIKDDILMELSNYNTNFKLTYEGDFSKIKSVVQNAMSSIQKNNQYIYENMSKWKVGMKYKGTKGTLTFKINYLTDKKKEQYVTAQVKKILPTIIKRDATDKEKVKAVHDYIVLNSSYSSKTKNSQYSTYTLLTEGKGVCQAYALLMLKMLEELNVEAKYVKGFSNNISHAWILAKVENEWYHIDPTWNDPIGNKQDHVYYQYYMLSDKEIAKTHSWEKADYPVAKK